MYDFLEGRIVRLNEDNVVIQSGGAGYAVKPSQAALSSLPQPGETARLYVHLEVKEDDLSLYGFENRQERELFRLVLSVSRIGPKTALRLLSAMKGEQVREAVAQEEEKMLTSVKGIGKKTARRLILELKDKISDLEMEPSASAPQTNTSLALQALTSESMGFSNREAREALSRVREEEGSELEVQELIQNALQELSS